MPLLDRVIFTGNSGSNSWNSLVLRPHEFLHPTGKPCSPGFLMLFATGLDSLLRPGIDNPLPRTQHGPEARRLGSDPLTYQARLRIASVVSFGLSSRQAGW